MTQPSEVSELEALDSMEAVTQRKLSSMTKKQQKAFLLKQVKALIVDRANLKRDCVKLEQLKQALYFEADKVNTNLRLHKDVFNFIQKNQPTLFKKASNDSC